MTQELAGRLFIIAGQIVVAFYLGTKDTTYSPKPVRWAARGGFVLVVVAGLALHKLIWP